VYIFGGSSGSGFGGQHDESTSDPVYLNDLFVLKGSHVYFTSGLKITAVQRTMSDQNGDLTSQKVHSPVMLTGHVMLRRSRCSFLNKQSNLQL